MTIPGDYIAGDVLSAANVNLLSARVYAATVAAAESTASATFVALATAGPAVTCQTRTTALVTVSMLSNNGVVGNSCFMGVAVSGATTIAASSLVALTAAESDIANSDDNCRQILVTGLTPGSNTFTAQYRVNSGSGTFTNRVISVVAL